MDEEEPVSKKTAEMTLGERIESLEKAWWKAGVYAGALSLAFVVFLGISWKTLPGRAVEAAEERLKGEAIATFEARTRSAAETTEAMAEEATGIVWALSQRQQVVVGTRCYEPANLVRCYHPTAGDHLTWFTTAEACKGVNYNFEHERSILAEVECAEGTME